MKNTAGATHSFHLEPSTCPACQPSAALFNGMCLHAFFFHFSLRTTATYHPEIARSVQSRKAEHDIRDDTLHSREFCMVIMAQTVSDSEVDASMAQIKVESTACSQELSRNLI